VSVDCLHVGRCQVVWSSTDPSAALPSDLETAVTEIWAAETSRRPGLYNGILLSAVADSLGTLRVRASEYRHFLAQRRHPELAARLQVNPVAVSGLVVTSDDHWIFGRRGATVTQYPLHLESVPSGTLDERALAGQQSRPGLVLDPTLCLLAELSEEAGLDPADVAEVQPLGLFVDVEERTYDLGYLLRLRRSAAEIQQALRGAEGPEYFDLRALHRDEVPRAMAEAEVTPTTRLLWDTLPRLLSSKGS
jgi:hypothetical protein